MVEPQLEQSIRGATQMMNTGDFSSFDDLMANDVTYRSTNGDKVQGLDGLKKLREIYSEAFEDFKIEPQQIYGENNRAVVIYQQTGTHVGEFMGVEASHNEWNQLGCNVITFDDDGKIVDVYDIFDNLELLHQLDALPDEMTDYVGTETRPRV